MEKRAILCTVLYAMGYFLMTLADRASTNYMIGIQAGTELNPFVVDQKTNGLEARFLLIQAVIGSGCVAAFAWGYARRRQIEDVHLRNGFSTLLLRMPWTDKGTLAYHWLCSSLAVMVMKILVPISNMGAAAHLTLPGMIRSILGLPKSIGTDARLLFLTVLTSAVIGILIAVPWTGALLRKERHDSSYGRKDGLTSIATGNV
jgi:hypothetical protein